MGVKSISGNRPAALKKIINWARSRSMIPYVFNGDIDTDCLISDMESDSRLSDSGLSSPAFSPRQADLLLITGRINRKMKPILETVYEQMAEPKWVIALDTASGNNTSSSYAVDEKVSDIIPVDIEESLKAINVETLADAVERLREKILSL